MTSTCLCVCVCVWSASVEHDTSTEINASRNVSVTQSSHGPSQRRHQGTHAPPPAPATHVDCSSYSQFFQ